MPKTLDFNLLKRQEPPPERANPFKEEQESSFFEVAGAQFMNAFVDTDSQLIVRKIQNEFEEATSDDVMDPQQLNEMFPGMPVPFGEPTSLSVAKNIVATQRQRETTQRIINKGDPDSLLQKTSGVLMSLAANVVDPIGIAVGNLIGAGVVRVAGKALANTKRGAQLAKTIANPGLKREIVEGVIGNPIQELLVAKPLMEEERQDYDTFTNLSIAAGAGFLFPLAKAGLGKTMDKLLPKRNPEEGAARIADTVEQQLQSGKAPNTEVVASSLKRQELPQVQKELDEALANGELERASELREELRSLNEIPEHDRIAEMQRANAPEADMHHDSDVWQEYQAAIDRGDFESDLDQEILEDLDSFARQREEFVNSLPEGENPPKVIEEAFEEANQLQSRLEELDRLTKEATFCVGRS